MTSTEKYVSEAELNEKAVAPRVTLELLEANIKSETYFTAADGMRGAGLEPNRPQHLPLTLITYCVLTLNNEFTVTGQSACASPENYDQKIGQRVARGDAVRQVWALMGYELRSKLHRMKQLAGADERLGESLTRLTAYGLGNCDALRMRDVDAILNHFTGTDHQEEGGATFSRDVITGALDLPRDGGPIREHPPEFSGYLEMAEEDVKLIERNELGAAHPDQIAEPTITEESVR